jgi:hypothetical protein
MSGTDDIKKLPFLNPGYVYSETRGEMPEIPVLIVMPPSFAD